MDRQSFWNNSYSSAKSRGYSSFDAKIIADKTQSQYIEQENFTGTRSMAVNSNFTQEGDVFDILVGYSDSGVEENLNDSLDSSGFDNFDTLTTKADMEHFNHDFAGGIANNLDEKWQHFAIESEMYKSGNEIRAKIKPSSELDNEFIEDYKSGKYGASIEYKGIKEGNKIVDWNISGFSFTKNPHYNQTIPKNTENK